MTRKVRRIIAVAIALVLLAVAMLVTPPEGGLWLRTFYDATHVPLFGAIGVGAIVMTPRPWPMLWRFAAAMAVVVVLGVVTEFIQIPTSRDASLGDLLADILGGFGTLCLAVGLLSRATLAGSTRVCLAAVGLVTLAVPLAPLADVTLAYWERARALPELVRFESRHAEKFARTRNAEWTRVETGGAKGTSARVSLGDGQWPGVTLGDVWPDWRDFQALEIDIENPQSVPMPLRVRIDDRDHRRNQSPSDRFNRQVALAPGRRVVRIMLADVRTAPAGRTMDLSTIDRVIVYAGEDQAGREFIIHGVRLSADGETQFGG